MEVGSSLKEMDRERGNNYGDDDHPLPESHNTHSNDYHPPPHPFDNHGHHHHHHRRNHHHHHSFNPQPNESFSAGDAYSFPLAPRKRSAPADYIDGCNFVKLYVGAVPRTATEDDIRTVFGEHGDIVEVVLIKDKRTGQQQECCFVKYATIDSADRAIEALHHRYTFHGGVMPIKVKYADRERVRLGNSQSNSGTESFDPHIYKVYVGCLKKQASKREIEEIFSPYGVVENIYIVRDEWQQNRGCAFVQFSHRDMAVAAINALHGTFVMEGCEHPLIVRFADPKKPRTGEPRGSSQFGGSGFGPGSQESVVRSAPYHSDAEVGHMLPQDFHPLIPKRVVSSSQSPRSKSKPQIFSSNATALEPVLPSTPAVPKSAETADLPDSDWSEHVCPDGYNYYYNCVTHESMWEKPEEYALHEQHLQSKQQKHPCQQLNPLSHQQVHTEQVSEMQHVQSQAELSLQQLQQHSLSSPVN